MSDQIDISSLTDATDHTVQPRSVIKSESWNTMVNDFKAQINNLNDAVQDLETQHAKTTAPQSTPEGKIYAKTDTNPPVWKAVIDGSSNTADIVLASTAVTMTGKTLASAAIIAPSMSGTVTHTQASNSIAYDFRLSSTTADGVNFTSTATTTGNIIDIPNADALTSGTVLNIKSNSSSQTSRAIVKIHQDHADASDAAIPLVIIQDGTAPAIKVTGNIDISGSVTAGGGAKLLQQAASINGAVDTGGVAIPNDDTIPQNTEGTEFTTLAFTPSSASSTLEIEFFVTMGCNAANKYWTIAMFVDSTADAIGAQLWYETTADVPRFLRGTIQVASGSTTARTYKLRYGANDTSTCTINGYGGARKAGGVLRSGFTVKEFL